MHTGEARPWPDLHDSCMYPLHKAGWTSDLPHGMQVVRSRIQQRQDVYRGVRYESSWRSVQVILRREGIRGLYKGLVPNVLRVMPQSAITFLVYEKVMQLLDKHLQLGSESR